MFFIKFFAYLSKWNIFNSKLEDYKSIIDSLITDINKINNLSFINEKFDDLYLGEFNIKILETKLITIEDFKNFLINYFNNITGLFAGCSSLKYLPDISKWNIQNTTDISNLFAGCTS